MPGPAPGPGAPRAVRRRRGALHLAVGPRCVCIYIILRWMARVCVCRTVPKPSTPTYHQTTPTNTQIPPTKHQPTDFRPDYLTLRTIRDKFPGVPIMALTATATATVRQDIFKVCCSLGPLVCWAGAWGVGILGVKTGEVHTLLPYVRFVHATAHNQPHPTPPTTGAAALDHGAHRAPLRRIPLRLRPVRTNLYLSAKLGFWFALPCRVVGPTPTNDMFYTKLPLPPNPQPYNTPNPARTSSSRCAPSSATRRVPSRTFWTCCATRAPAARGRVSCTA